MIVRLVAKLLALLNSNRRAVEIAAAAAFGLWLALVPTTNLLFVALALLVFLVKVNLGMAMVSFAGFSLLVPLIDPALDRFGYRILTAPALVDLFRAIYAVPVVPLTRFNDTLVAGGFIAGALLFVPVTAVAILFVRAYRKYVHARIANSKLVRAIKATPFAQKVGAAVGRLRHVWPTT